MSMEKIYLDVAFDDKDRVRDAHGIRWDGTRKRWYATDAAVAIAAQALADELAGERDFAQREQEAVDRKMQGELARQAASRAAETVKNVASTPTLLELDEYKKLCVLARRQKFLLAGEEKRLRAIACQHREFFEGFGLPFGTRNSTEKSQLARAGANIPLAMGVIAS
jgi:hypothetical protein